MQSRSSSNGLASAPLCGSSKLIGGSPDNSPRVDTVQVVVGRFWIEVFAVDAKVIKRCGCALGDPFLEVLHFGQGKRPGECQIDQRAARVSIQIP